MTGRLGEYATMDGWRTGRRAGGVGREPRLMNVKRWFRGPWLWVVLFAILVLVVLDVVSNRSGYKRRRHLDDGAGSCSPGTCSR